MTSIRKSFVFSKEDSFGKGKGADYVWIAPPPGSYISNTHTRQTTRLQATGSKRWDKVSYGSMSGTWEWTFMLDYEYLEPLTMAFEDYSIASSSVAGTYLHTFKKDDCKRVGSFVIRQKILNNMAGGPAGSDEMEELYGCVCTDITFARSAGTSQTQVTMSGFYADEKMVKGSLAKTDFRAYDGSITEYSCMFIGDIADANYIGETQSLSLAVSNGCEGVWDICGYSAQGYSESTSKYTFSTSCYSNDPSRYKQRVYSGGVSNAALKPRTKGMAPIPRIHVLSYDAEVDDNNTTRVAAYNASSQSMDMELDEVVIRSLQWQNGDGTKLLDSISSTEFKELRMTFKTKIPTYQLISTNKHVMTSSDPTSSYMTSEGVGE